MKSGINVSSIGRESIIDRTFKELTQANWRPKLIFCAPFLGGAAFVFRSCVFFMHLYRVLERKFLCFFYGFNNQDQGKSSNGLAMHPGPCLRRAHF